MQIQNRTTVFYLGIIMTDSRKSSFSLTELAVVVSLLFIIAALLLPAYSRAESKAQKVTCAGNLKVMGIALSIYADDSDDVHLPATRIYAQDPMQNWLYYLHYASKVSNEHLTCPDEPDTFAFVKLPPNTRPRMRFSYGMHYEAVQDNYTALHPRFTRSQQREHGQNPSEHVWLGDSASDTLGKRPAVKNGYSALLSSHGGYFEGDAIHAGSGWHPVSVRHSGKANMLMFDGHVESFSGKELFANDLRLWKPMFYDWKWQEN